MRVVRCPSTFLNPELQKKLEDSVVGLTIGNFDGIHLGHQRLFSELDQNLKELSTKLGKPALKILISFWPHPRQVLSGISRTEALSRTDFFNLTTFRKKTNLIAENGFDYFFPIRFSKTFSRLSPVEFVQEYFLNILRASVVVVGDDWSFGSERLGDANELVRLGGKYNFSVKVISAVRQENLRVSSGSIKKLLNQGDFAAIAQGLNRNFSVIGRVVKGAGRGRELGFPTANLKLIKQLLPADGVYAGVVIYQGKRHPAISNIGVRPTFGEHKRVLEVHLLEEQNLQLYSQHLELEFIEKIRDEIRFSSKEDLVQAIKIDIEKAKKILNANT